MPHILVVEDHRFTADAIERLLKENGMAVRRVESGRDALQILRTIAFDLIVLELILYDIDGVELIRQIRDAHIGTPIIVASGRNDANSAADALKAGANDYLRKPFYGQQLVEMISKVLWRSREYGSPIISIGNLTLNRMSKSVTVADQPVVLTAREFLILDLLCHYWTLQQRATRAMLSAGSGRSFNVLMGRLKRKLRDWDWRITNPSRKGYKLERRL